MFFEQVGEFHHQPTTFTRVHPRPLAAVELRAGRVDGEIDVGRIALRDLGDNFFGRRMDRVERLAAGRREPLSTDKTLRLMNLRTSDLFGDRGHAC